MSGKITVAEETLKAVLIKHLCDILKDERAMKPYQGMLIQDVFRNVVPLVVTRAVKELRP